VPKYLVLYRADVAALEQMANSTPEQQQAGMDAWNTWAAKAGNAVVDLGSPLSPKRHLGPGSGLADVCGYSMLECDSAEAAEAALDGHPHTEWGGSIDVVELLSIPGM
jgi:hypothetical protein